MKVTVLSGISGSGKSTYIQDCCDTREVSRGGAKVVSADHYFISLKTGEYNFNPSHLSLAHGECFRRFIRAMMDHEASHIVVDNTNTTESEISPYMLGASAFGYDAEIVTMRPPKGMTIDAYIEACAARNAHGVPYAGIKAQFQRLMARYLPPWWEANDYMSQF